MRATTPKDEPIFNVVLSYPKLKLFALAGIDNYLIDVNFEGDNWHKVKTTLSFAGGLMTGTKKGFWHGEMGRNRAQKMKEQLEDLDTKKLEAKDSEEIKKLLAILWSIFGDPKPSNLAGNLGLDWVLGRSNQLANRIAKAYFDGQYRTESHGENIKNLKSNVFNTVTPLGKQLPLGVETYIADKEVIHEFENVSGTRYYLEAAITEYANVAAKNKPAVAVQIEKEIRDKGKTIKEDLERTETKENSEEVVWSFSYLLSTITSTISQLLPITALSQLLPTEGALSKFVQQTTEDISKATSGLGNFFQNTFLSNNTKSSSEIEMQTLGKDISSSSSPSQEVSA